MKVLFVKPGSADLNYPNGLASLMAYARREGHRVSFHDASLTRDTPEFTAEIVNNAKPDLVAISVLTGWHEWARRFVYRLDVDTVVGGPHISGIGPQAVAHIGATFGVVGEGEIRLGIILNTDMKNSVDRANPGIILKKHLTYIQNPGKYSMVSPLDTLPLPDYDAIPPKWYFHAYQAASVAKRHKEICQIITSRGCPYHCTFCATQATWEGKIRFFSPERVLNEIETLVYRHGVREIWIGDDGFTAHKGRAIEICERMIRANLRVPWRIPNGIRLDTLDEQLVRMMARAGCYMVGIGVETGSPEMMDRIKKRLDLGIVREKVSLLSRYGITSSGFFILGFPGETPETMRATTEFILRSNFPRVQICTYRPVPGSESFDEIFVTEEQIDQYLHFGQVPTIPRDVTEEEVASAYWRTLARFYSKPRILADLALDVRWGQVKDIYNRFIRRNP